MRRVAGEQVAARRRRRRRAGRARRRGGARSRRRPPGCAHAITWSRSFSYQRKPRMSSLRPCRMPQTLAPVCELQSVCQSVSAVAAAGRASAANVGMSPSRTARRTVSKPRPSTCRNSTPGRPVVAVGGRRCRGGRRGGRTARPRRGPSRLLTRARRPPTSPPPRPPRCPGPRSPRPGIANETPSSAAPEQQERADAQREHRDRQRDPQRSAATARAESTPNSQRDHGGLPPLRHREAGAATRRAARSATHRQQPDQQHPRDDPAAAHHPPGRHGPPRAHGGSPARCRGDQRADTPRRRARARWRAAVATTGSSNRPPLTTPSTRVGDRPQQAADGRRPAQPPPRVVERGRGEQHRDAARPAAAGRRRPAARRARRTARARRRAAPASGRAPPAAARAPLPARPTANVTRSPTSAASGGQQRSPAAATGARWWWRSRRPRRPPRRSAPRARSSPSSTPADQRRVADGGGSVQSKAAARRFTGRVDRAAPPAAPGSRDGDVRWPSPPAATAAANTRGGSTSSRRIRAPGPPGTAREPGERRACPSAPARRPAGAAGRPPRRRGRGRGGRARASAPSPRPAAARRRAARARPCRRTGRCRPPRRRGGRPPPGGGPSRAACGRGVERGPQRWPLCVARARR